MRADHFAAKVKCSKQSQSSSPFAIAILILILNHQS
jgi:hypothetical protein